MGQPRLDLIGRASEYARYAHVHQKRKYTGEPYINHCAAVAKLVAGAGLDDECIAAAWLHDTVEDTEVTLRDIETSFGKRVATLVCWLTDISKPQHGNRATRKALDRAHLAMAPADAKSIKLADLIDNTGSIAQHDPEFARIYLAEKERLLAVLTEGNASLYGQALKTYNEAVNGEPTPLSPKPL